MRMREDLQRWDGAHKVLRLPGITVHAAIVMIAWQGLYHLYGSQASLMHLQQLHVPHDSARCQGCRKWPSSLCSSKHGLDIRPGAHLARVSPTLMRRSSATKPMDLPRWERTAENSTTSFSRPCGGRWVA